MKTPRSCFDGFNTTTQKKYLDSAVSTVDHIMTIEPRLEHPLTEDCVLWIGIQSDQKGQSGTCET